jgi:hypothetical protein
LREWRFQPTQSPTDRSNQEIRNMVATEVDIDEDNFKSSHGNMLSKEQETVDLEGF